MSNTKQQPSRGVGCLTILGLIFIVLKLTGNITWSWWWVLSPFIFQAVTVALFMLFVVVIASMSRRRRW